MKNFLILKGFEIAGIANDGEEAVSMFKSFLVKPEVIIMDHRMPIKNGLEAAKEILEIDNNIRIIITSADESVKDEALAIGVFSFKNKPFEFGYLVANIKKALEPFPTQ